MSPENSPVRLESLRKTYGRGTSAVTALDGVTVDFAAGALTAVMGPSGSGKSTLLHCAAGLDRPTSGSVTLAGTPLAGLSETRLTLLRRSQVAFIFQSFNLMPALNVWQNVTLPALLAGQKSDKALVSRVIETVGLSDRIKHRPGELSGGQQQRVAIARALASRVRVIFADEPTGALDTHTAAGVLALMRELTRAGQTVVMVTHDPVAASYADSVLFLVDGRVVSQHRSPSADSVAAALAGLSSRARSSQPGRLSRSPQ
jgi:putative ABC transport system ATP-binding protein